MIEITVLTEAAHVPSKFQVMSDAVEEVSPSQMGSVWCLIGRHKDEYDLHLALRQCRRCGSARASRRLNW